MGQLRREMGHGVGREDRKLEVTAETVVNNPGG